MQPGDLIAGKYRIDQVLGQGGMGMVVAATNLHLDRRVALKFLLPELMHDTAVMERFLREARASARLRSEHVCRVYDVGVENGAPFMVMELLEGRDLASTLSHNGAMPVPIAADCVLQATMGLAEAHALGIIHRDLKPANLFAARQLDGTPLIKILDFGIAKAPSDSQFQLTRTTAVMGSPGYMSPEQLRSTRDTDARSDIWALGVILFELVSGRPPFVAESITELTLRIVMDPTPTLPGVPREFERVVACCLEKDPNRRFANVSQLAAALAPFGSARIAEAAVSTASMLSMSATGGTVRAPTSEPAPTTLRSAAGSDVASPRHAGSRVRWGVVGVAMFVAIGVIVIATRGGSDTPAAAQPRDEKPLTSQSPEPPAPPTAATAVPVLPATQAASPATLSLDAGIPTDATIAPPPQPRPAAAQATPALPPNAASRAQLSTTAPSLPGVAQPPSGTSAPPVSRPRTKPAPTSPLPSKATPTRDVGESRE